MIEDFKSDVIIDAIFGFSFKGRIRENYEKLFNFLKLTNIPIISIDVPSGWDINEGNRWKTFNPNVNISLGT